MAIENFPVFCYYDVQRFKQFSGMDAANWYITEAPSGKKQKALYPAMGRRHVEVFNQTVLNFEAQPRAIFKSINFAYVVVGGNLYQINNKFAQTLVIDTVAPGTQLSSRNPISFAYLPVGTKVYCLISDQVNLFLIDESVPGQMQRVTSANRPPQPAYIVAFGDRFVVSSLNSNIFYLSTVGTPNPTNMFVVSGGAVFASASGVIKQLAVLQEQMYVFSDFDTEVWANIPSVLQNAQFPFKKNTSYSFNFGIADPQSLDIDFGMMVWLGQNRNGLVSFYMSDGQKPQAISTQAINVLLQKQTSEYGLSPFLVGSGNGFLYQYEDTIFYRVVAGDTLDFGVTQFEDTINCLEFNFDTKTWHRCIELDGTRSLIQDHTFFSNKHLVTVIGQTNLYEMAGNIYTNEVRNTEQPNINAPDAFTKFPFRYELVTPPIVQEGYVEFITDYVEIDFVFGETLPKGAYAFENTVFLVTEDSTPEAPVFMIAENDQSFLITEDSNTPQLQDVTYNDLFKPHIELWFSDDGGIEFKSADVREFSPLGDYRWRMRWYELGASRNRVYKLIGVSPYPIVVLGAVQNIRRASGGAN